jgi:hypothetical protein
MKKIIYILLIYFHLCPNLFPQSEWFLQNPLVNTTGLNSIKFFNESIGWAVGNEGVIVNTTDGGESWRNQVSGTTIDLYSVFLPVKI